MDAILEFFFVVGCIGLLLMAGYGVRVFLPTGGGEEEKEKRRKKLLFWGGVVLVTVAIIGLILKFFAVQDREQTPYFLVVGLCLLGYWGWKLAFPEVFRGNGGKRWYFGLRL